MRAAQGVDFIQKFEACITQWTIILTFRNNTATIDYRPRATGVYVESFGVSWTFNENVKST